MSRAGVVSVKNRVAVNLNIGMGIASRYVTIVGRIDMNKLQKLCQKVVETGEATDLHAYMKEKLRNPELTQLIKIYEYIDRPKQLILCKLALMLDKEQQADNELKELEQAHKDGLI